MDFSHYSLRNASIGLSLLAFLAGAHPNMIPTAAENPTPSPIADMDIVKLVLSNCAPAKEINNPRITPTIPPISESTIASNRN